MRRKNFRCWVGERIAARPVLKPYPGWILGSAERRGAAARMRSQLWPWFSKEFEIKWLDGLRVRLQPASETSRAIFVTGRYEPNEFCVLDRILKPGMTFLDIGANVGLYTLFAAKRVMPNGRVLAIEPSSREYEILTRNIDANCLCADRPFAL
jgi:hypothetical protein